MFYLPTHQLVDIWVASRSFLDPLMSAFLDSLVRAVHCTSTVRSIHLFVGFLLVFPSQWGPATISLGSIINAPSLVVLKQGCFLPKSEETNSLPFRSVCVFTYAPKSSASSRVSETPFLKFIFTSFFINRLGTDGNMFLLLAVAEPRWQLT